MVLGISYAEWLGFITGFVCVYLVVKENPWTWPVGILNNIFFLVLFWRSGLFADSLLQIFYMVISAYGLWNWLYGGKNHSVLKVSRSTGRQLAGYLVSIGVLTFLIYMALVKWSPSTVPLWDGLTTAMSLTAQYMMTKKRLENWWVWITADVIYIALYIHKALYLTAILYLIFIGLCVMGLQQWKDSYTQDPESSPEKETE